MEGYRDLHLALAAGHYASRYPAGYGGDRRASYDPLYTVYPRAAVDPYGGYAYQPPEYSYVMSPRRRPIPKRRPTVQANGRQRPAPPQSLTPRKKPFKKTQKGFQVAEAKPQRKAQEVAAKPKKGGGSTLAKETEDLHKLFRTGVDSGIKIVKPKEVANGVGKKRKADAKKGTPTKKKGMAKNKKFGKGKKKDVKKAEKAVEAVKAPLTEEEKQEMEIALELQKTACKAFAEFFEIPVKVIKPELEAGMDELAEADVGAEKTEATGEEEKTEEAVKASPKPKLTPEMAKEIELKALNFFTKVLADNDELSKLYLNKKDAGTFECLVCHSINPEASKRFNNVTGLVSHTIMRRQRRPEHRGFGKAICQIFGWEPLRPNKSIKQATAVEEIVKDVLMEKAEAEIAEKQETTEEE